MQPLPPNYIFSGPVSEDCLYLNVWSTPNTTKEATLKPVMFWIYGGAYKFGSIFTPLYNGGVLATKDVVIVTANYRLGPFGFLYDGTDKAPGNMALYDQILALKWVGTYKFLSGMVNSRNHQWTSLQGGPGGNLGGGSSGSTDTPTSKKIPFLYYSHHSEKD